MLGSDPQNLFILRIRIGIGLHTDTSINNFDSKSISKSCYLLNVLRLNNFFDRLITKTLQTIKQALFGNKVFKQTLFHKLNIFKHFRGL